MQTPIILAIGGSDPTGGAGIQADTATISQLGGLPQTVITSLTAQNTSGVLWAEALATEQVRAQLQALSNDFKFAAIKVGLIPNLAVLDCISEWLESVPGVPLIWDPVLSPTKGKNFTSPEVATYLTARLGSRIDLLTPNSTELETLTGHAISSSQNLEGASKDLISKGFKTILAKGGHLKNNGVISDLLYSKNEKFWMTNPSWSTSPHGTGCTLASAIATFWGKGDDLSEAVVRAKMYLNQCASSNEWLKAHPAPKVSGSYLPSVTTQKPTETACEPFLPESKSMGFYPIVPNLEWLHFVLKAGAKTVQLRVKNSSEDELEMIISSAVAFGRQYQAHVYINDYWQQAIKHQAYGIHLGQEDLITADLLAIKNQGLRLGISTHSYQEAAIAKDLQPSYVALGPIFPTTCKSMRFGPQGIKKITHWSRLFTCPIVAIGGLNPEHGLKCLKAGAHGIAAISDFTEHKEPQRRLQEWLNLVGPPKPN